MTKSSPTFLHLLGKNTEAQEENMTCLLSLVHLGMKPFLLSHRPVHFLLYHLPISASSPINIVLKDNPVFSLVD